MKTKLLVLITLIVAMTWACKKEEVKPAYISQYPEQLHFTYKSNDTTTSQVLFKVFECLDELEQHPLLTGAFRRDTSFYWTPPDTIIAVSYTFAPYTVQGVQSGCSGALTMNKHTYTTSTSIYDTTDFVYAGVHSNLCQRIRD